jgi:flavin reductase (DIM6/NTAB) family NADH-FMN oxidoreductase RutF
MRARSLARRVLRPLPQWCAIALRPPQKQVQVELRSGTLRREVTGNLVVAALRPLTLGIGLDAAMKHSLELQSDIELYWSECVDGRRLGALRLQRPQLWHAAGSDIGLFEIASGVHQCLPWPYRPWNRWLQNRAMSKNRDPHNFALSHAASEQLMIFYICPRPVVLVSVETPSHSNIFPMDLIGNIEPGLFTLALRSTSISIPVLRELRRAALSSVPASDRALAYGLGAHHKNPLVSWHELPFVLERSSRFSLPVPATALRVREVEIDDFREIGSHTFFVTRVVSDHPVRQEEQLHHTSGFHQDFRLRHGRPFAVARE